MRANIPPQSHNVSGVLQEVFMDVLAEDDLLLHRDIGIEVYLQFARPFRPAGQLYTELSFGERLEISGITPKLILNERRRVMQPNDQRSVDVVEEAVEAIAHQHRRMPDQFRTLASVVAWK